MTEIPEHLLRRSKERRQQLEPDAGAEPVAEGAAAATPAPEAKGPQPSSSPSAGTPPTPSPPTPTPPPTPSPPSPSPTPPSPPAVAPPPGDPSGKIPAHLLARSQARRQEVSGSGSGDVGAGAPAASGGDGGAGAKAEAPASAPARPAGAATTATAVASAPTAAPPLKGPEGHTQRLLTVVKAGSIQDVKATPTDKVFVWPHLLVTEFLSALLITAFLLIFAVFVNAPLQGLANVNQTPNPSKAPWYFLGLQELLTMFHPMVAGVTIPGVGIFALMMAPYVDRNPSAKPEDRKFAIALMVLFIMFWAVLVIIGSFFRGPGFNFILPWQVPIRGEIFFL